MHTNISDLGILHAPQMFATISAKDTYKIKTDIQ